MAETVGNKRVIQGEDIIILVDDQAVLHATNHNLKVDLELKDIRTKDTNGKEKYPGDISWSVDGEGLVIIDSALKDSRASAEDVLDMVITKQLVGVILKCNITGAIRNYKGNAYVTSFSLGTPAGDNATFNYTLTGSGNLEPVSGTS